jgi:flagellar hook-length control protein FliK
MTTTAGTASSAPSAPSPNGSNAARQTGASAASSRPGQGPKNAMDLFANLLGLVSAGNDAPTLLAASVTDAIDIASDPDTTDALGNLLPDGSANPLADLIGWAGAPASVAGAKSSPAKPASDALVGKDIAAGTTPPAASDAGKGVSLQGMTVLAQPSAADASLLAGLKPGAHGAASANALAQASPTASADSVNVSVEVSAQANHPASTLRANTIAASRPANWRSTATLGSSNPLANSPTSSSTTTSLQIAQNAQSAQSAVGLRGHEASVASSSRSSALALNERFGSAVAAQAGTSEVALGSAQSLSSQSNSHSSGNGEAAFGALSAPEAHDIDSPDQEFSLEAELAPEEELDPNAFLSPDRLRHANVRVGEGTDEAIDIRLSLEGDAVKVNFRTDNAEVRAGLQHNANGSLSDLLQRSGLQLDGVSVGGQSQQPSGQSRQSGQSSGQTGPNGLAPRSQVADTSDPSQPRSDLARTPVARRADGGPALDVFA